MSPHIGHMSVKLRSRDELVLEVGGQRVVIHLRHARRGEARLVVEAPRSVSILNHKRQETP